MTAKLFCLHSDEASLVFEQDAKGCIVWRHCGARVEPKGLPPLADIRGPATYSLDEDVPPAIAPPAGLGWFGPPALAARGPDGRALHFSPAESEAEQADDAVIFTSRDPQNGLEHRLTITTLAGGAFKFAATVTNRGARPVMLDRLAGALLPIRSPGGQIISWRGRHNAELVPCREPLPQHRWERVTRGGISGHGGPPGAYIVSAGATHDTGLVHALQLAWSGDSAVAVERDAEGYHHLSAEVCLQAGEVTLAPAQSFAAPEALLAISTNGRNGAMQQHHAAIRAMIGWPGGAMTPRPVHLNSWEAVYFDHDAARIERLAHAGAAIGAERFVLDDGWFKGRRHDRAGLGDWTPDPATYPDGLAPLARKIDDLGVQFGLWVEPEMVNPDSDLYRAHPDWVLAAEGYDRATARGQLVLDMRRQDVGDYLFGALDSILRSAPIAYLKWDHNRHHAPSGGAAQMAGAYALLSRLRQAHPQVEIESCAGGGGRSDAGMAAHVHRFWTSDNLDAVARVGMQRGFLAFLPPEMMGTHVGATPAHATGRSQSLAFRAAIACLGHFGVELDPATLPNSERAELADWIAFYKQWRHLLHGRAVHLGEGTDGIVWQAHGGPDEWLLFAVRTAPAQDRLPQSMPLRFLGSTHEWSVSLLRLAEHSSRPGLPQSRITAQMQAGGVSYSGDWLSAVGLPLPAQHAESVAIYRLTSDTTP